MYIQENSAEEERSVPPDYRGHTYAPPSAASQAMAGDIKSDGEVEVQEETEAPKSAPAGAFSGIGDGGFDTKGGKRGDFFGSLGLGNLFSRIPFLSSLAPPPRQCENSARGRGALWDWVLLAVVALSILNGKDDDVLPLLLLLLLWD